MHMIKWMCGVSLKYRRTREELRKMVGVELITNVIRSSRLRWYEYVMLKNDEDWLSELKVHGNVRDSETTLPIGTRRTIVQLRTNKCHTLHSNINKIVEEKHPSPLCLLCKTEPHTITHLFNCTKINTHLKVTDL